MKRFSTVVILAATIFGTSKASAAENAYLRFSNGELRNPAVPSGQYRASIDSRSISDLLNTISRTLVSPRDPASGQATGKRTHKPLRARMYYDQAVPLAKALARNKSIGELKLTLVRPASKGHEEIYFTITLQDATLMQMRRLKQSGDPHEQVEFTLAYQKIEVAKMNKLVPVNAWKSG